MNNNDNKQTNGFKYTYSAKEQTELKNIRKKYLNESKTGERNKMEQIRKLDASVTNKASGISLCVGIIGALVMGFGMSLIMSDLKEILGSHRDMVMLIGIIIGVIGMVGVITAYPLYQYVISKERKKAAPEILRLTEELMEGNND